MTGAFSLGLAPHHEKSQNEALSCSVARSIVNGETSASHITRAAIERLKEVGPRFNALAWLNEKQSCIDAEAADVLARTVGQSALMTHPLLGLPITVKEGLRVAGAPWMMGSKLHQRRVAELDGSVVSRLRTAGAVIVGLGAMAEMALWPETVNRITGRAIHPLDSTRTPGGSSGGDAALVSSGAVTAAIGADGGGSVRIPAAYCGLYAHKPSAGMIPLAGHIPMDEQRNASPVALAKYFTPGPLAKNAHDLWPLLSVMAGSDGVQPGINVPLPSQIPSAGMLSGKTVYVLSAPKLNGGQSADVAQINAVTKAANALQAQGAILREARADLIEDAFLIWLGTLRCAADFDMELVIGNGTRLRLLPEIAAQMVGRGQHTAAGLVLAISARFDPTGPRYWRKWAHRGEALAMELADMLAPDALLLCPPVAGAAPRHNSAFLHPFNIGMCAVFNALGNPATVAPILTGPEGLPRAVQIVARCGADHLTVSAALALAKENCPLSHRTLQ